MLNAVAVVCIVGTSSRQKMWGRQGGWRMQVAAMDRDRSPRRVHRHYQPVLRHLQSWADGACTTPQVWWHIDALAAEGIEHPAVQPTHALATHIRDQNLGSSLVNLLTETCKLGNFIYSIPDRGRSVDHCLRPGQMISLMRTNPSKLKLRMGADTELLAEFWDGYRRSDVGKRYCAMHCHLRNFSDEDYRYALPCVLHEDAGPYGLGKGRSCSIVSWSVLTGRGSDVQTKFVHHTELKSTSNGLTSSQASWDRFFSDFDALAFGLDPETGEPIAVDPDELCGGS